MRCDAGCTTKSGLSVILNGPDSCPGLTLCHMIRMRPRRASEPAQDRPRADSEVSGQSAQAPGIGRLPSAASVCGDAQRRCQDLRNGLAVARDVTGATAGLTAKPQGSELGAGPLHPAPAAAALGGVLGELGNCFSRIATTLAESRNARMASLAHQCAGDIGGCASRRRRASIASRMMARMADFMASRSFRQQLAACRPVFRTTARAHADPMRSKVRPQK